jgi:Icc-related predicted phosphoesterase
MLLGFGKIIRKRLEREEREMKRKRLRVGRRKGKRLWFRLLLECIRWFYIRLILSRFMVETKYGIISDTHEQPGIVAEAIAVLKHLEIDKLVVNGDMGTGQDHMVHTLSQAGKSGLETFVQPGSHEKLEDFEPVMGAVNNEYPNVISAFDVPKVENNGHAVVFLPGSDFLCGGQYQLLRSDEHESGDYRNENSSIRLINMNDLSLRVTDPGKTVVVSHIPRRFNNGEKGVDEAYFARARDRSVVPGVVFERMVREQAGDVSKDELKKIAEQNGYDLTRENVGNEDLKALFDEIGIKKGVSGHIHESVHRACDSIGNCVREGEFVDELFWNASYLDGLKAGILRVDDGKIAYQNVDLQKYVA